MLEIDKNIKDVWTLNGMLKVENDFVPKLVDIIPSKLWRSNLGLDTKLNIKI
jgi:hypothetical protein